MSRAPQSTIASHVTSILLGLLATAGCAALCPLIILPLAWKDQAIFGAILILLAVLLNATSRSLSVTMLLMAISVFSTLRYGYWRIIQTAEGISSADHIHRWDSVFVLLLLLAEFFAFSTLILGYFQTLRPLKRPPLPLEGDPANWPSVDVLIPTYNEPLHVVRGTVEAAMAMDYPANKMRVLLLDDGRREEFREFATQVGVEYVTRVNNAHAKAGNINHALDRLQAEFVAIFDSDHVPARSFLQTTMGWFLHDPKLGLVQTPHHFYSPDPFERNLGQFRRVPNEGELFHRLVQDGNDLWNASFFCGSCAVLRRSALDEIGGIATETVTEDAHTALRMQCIGWNTAYINIPKAAGLATESLAAHVGQRIRWARGMTQILRIENPLFKSGLTFSQRLCYFNATTHFLFAIPRLIFLTVPLVYLLFGKVNIYGYTWAILAYALPHLVLSNLTNSRIQGRYRHSFWNEIYEVVLAPYILFPTLLALINPKLGKFNVTSKGGIIRRTYFDRRIALPYLFLLALNLAGLVMAERRYVSDPAHRDTVIMNAAWTAYNAMILSVAASVAWERRRLRSGACIRACVPAILKVASVRSREHQRDISGDTIYLSQNSVTLNVDTAVELPRGAPVFLALGRRGSECEIAALVAHSAGKRQHIFIPDLTVEQEEQIERLLRSQRKAWRSLRNLQPSDRPVRSLLQILLLGMRGLVILPIGLFMTAPESEPDPIPSRERSLAASFLIPLLLIGTASFAAQTHASEAHSHVRNAKSIQPEAAPPAGFTDTIELGAAGNAKNLALQSSGSSLNFFFDEPVTKITTGATLKLNYSAPNLQSNQARLQLTLNGAVAGSVALEPGAAQHVDFSLPTDLLTSDNTLSLELQGTCTQCGLKHITWVTLDPTSAVELSGTRLPLANDLSLLPLPFYDPAGSRPWLLPVAFGDQPDDVTLNGAALVASWLGVLSDVRGVSFPVNVGELPSGNTLVFALRSSRLLEGLVLPNESGPLIAMRDNPRDPYGKLLIITGNDSNELLEASRTLTNSKWMPHVDSLRSHGASFPGRPPYDAPRWLRTDVPSALGAYTTDERLRLDGTGSIDLYFRLPPDLFLNARQSIPLLLKVQYSGAPAGSRPALSVRLNGFDIDSIPLKPSTSSVQQTVQFRLPTGNLRPYTNTLTIDFYFANENPPANLHPSFAIRRDSTLDLRGLPHSVILPRLELFADAGYPFTQRPDLGRTAVILPHTPMSADLETLLDMAGFFGAQTGALATGIDVTTHTDDLTRLQEKDLVVIGEQGSQPLLSLWAASMPLALPGPEMQINEAPESSLLLHPAWPFREYDRQRLSRLLDDGNAQDAIVESFVSPLQSDRAVVAIVLNGPGAIDAVRALFNPAERQGPVYGGVAISQYGRFDSFLVGTFAYHAGEMDQVQYATVLLFENYRLIPILLLFLAGMIVAWVRWSTERVAARRLAMHQI